MCVRIFTIGLLFIISEGTKVEIGGFTSYLRERVFFFAGPGSRVPHRFEALQRERTVVNTQHNAQRRRKKSIRIHTLKHRLIWIQDATAHKYWYKMGLSLWNIFKVRSSPCIWSCCKLISHLFWSFSSHTIIFTMLPPKSGLLCTNALLILNRPRFLAKYGLDDVQNMGPSPAEKPLKYQAVGLLTAVQYLKVPVIVLNIVTIVFEILLGGS